MSARHRSRRGGRARTGGDAPVDAQPRAAQAVDDPVAQGIDLAPPAEEEPAVVEVVETVGDSRKPSCTLAQLRRFIKSRPYVPLHELRRRFSIEGYEDDVSGFATDSGPVYVGLPPAEAQLLGELVRAGEVGYEVLRDPVSPAIVGVYPMRPVARP